jgi:hypothetical protein
MKATIFASSEFEDYISNNWNKDDFYILINNDKIVYQDYDCSAICETWWNSNWETTHVIVINKRIDNENS